MRTRLAAASALAVLALGSCTKKEEGPPAAATRDLPAPIAPAARRVPGERDLFVVAAPKVMPGGLPARFSAPLPTTEAQLGRADQLPPEPYLTARLSAGDPATQAKLLAGLRKAAEKGPVPERLAGYYQRLFGYRPEGKACDWLLGQVSGNEPAAVREVLFGALTRCTEPRYAAAFARDDAPDAVIVDWLFEPVFPAKVPLHERYLRAAAAVAARGEEYEVRKVGFALARLEGEKAAAATRKALEGVADPTRRAWASLGLLRHASPELQALGQKACEHPAVKRDPMCDRTGAPGADPAGTKAGLDQEVADGTPVAELLAKHPRPEVEAALLRCLKGTNKDSEYSAALCLGSLAALDRAKAVEAARAVPAGGRGRLAQMVAALRKFPEKGALEKRLAELGFTRLEEPAGAAEAQAVTVEDALTGLGRVNSFDTETGMFPNQHDALMDDLARLVRPALDGAVFEEVAPDESHMDDAPYLLRAYLDGNRYELQAANNGDWYDVDAVMGLLNALLAARKSDQRLVTLPTGDQTATVLGGPEKGIRVLIQARLIEAEEPAAGMTNGKEFEQKVFDQLRRDGRLVAPGGTGGADLIER